MADHTVTWDHSGCEHAPGEESYCSPEGSITCHAVGPGEHNCRYCCDCEDTWYFCTNPEDHDDPEEHNDPGGPHCREGHLLRLGECNAVLSIDYSGGMVDSAADQPLTDFHDGLVYITYEGDGIYVWEYA